MIKKILLGILVLFLLVLAAAVVLPIVYKDKIVQLVKDEANKNLNAVVNFGEFDISIIKSFPDFSLTINNLSVAGINEFKGDTLTSIQVFSVTLDIMSVIQGDKMKIKSIVLKDPRIHAIVLKNGKANWDIAKGSDEKGKPETSEPSKFNIKLKNFSIENGYIVYDDKSMNMWTELTGLNHFLKGDFNQDLFTLITKTTIDQLSYTMDGVKYLSKAKCSLNADFDMDMLNSKYTFKQNELAVNELVLDLDGWMAMPKDDIDMDIKFKVTKSEFKNFISLVPGVYTKDFADAKISGKLGFDGYAKGTSSAKKQPAFGLNLLIENGMFKNPALPSALNNVQVNLKVTNPDGKPDHTLINLSKMHLEFGKEPFDVKLMVKTPVSDPQIDASMKGKINLSNIAQIVPLEEGTHLSGIVTSDLTAKGKMSSIEKQKYEEFNASGQLSITGLEYSSKEMKQATKIKTMQMTFNPRNVTLNNFDGSIGKSDMRMNGTLDNFIAYALKNETLKGKLDFNSNTLDLNEFMTDDANSATATTDTAAMTVFEVPKNIDFTLNAAISRLIYEDLNIANMKGSILVKNETITMSGLTMNMLDGKLTTNGVYATKNPKKPVIDFDLDVQDFDVQLTQKAFPTIRKMAPVSEKCHGKYSTNFKLKGDLDEHMQPLMNTLNGGGKLQTKNMSVIGFGPMVKVADALKMKQLETITMDNVNLSFKFSNGRVSVEPFDTKIGKSKTRIGGSNGFDETIDYTMNFEIPRSEFGGAANTALTGLVAEANKKGAKFTAGEMVNMDVKIGGTVKDPKVSTGLKNAAGNAADDLKAKGKEELDKAKKEAEDKARAEADRLKNEAEAKARGEADKAKQQAQAEADRVKKEAEDKAKAEADKAKKAAEEKAKKEGANKIKGLLGKPK